jgi:glucose/arabinose dehydrogenase
MRQKFPRSVRRRSPSTNLVLVLGALLLGAACDDDPLSPRDSGLTDAGSGGRGGSDGGGGTGGSDAGGATGDAAVGDGSGVPDAGQVIAQRPEKRDFTPALAATLKAPAGFKVEVFASGLGNPRWLAIGPDGATYVTLRMEGQVMRLRDGNADGDAADAGERTVVADAATNPALMGVHGITFHEGRVYLASIKSVVSAAVGPEGFSDFRTLVSDLPDGGQHPNRTIAVGPDGKLYVTVGSTCDACAETNSEHATMLRLELTGAAAADNPPNPNHPMLARDPAAKISPRVWASGLRNVLGFDWHPVTRTLWGSEHGSDGRGNDIPPDEVDPLVAGKSYGWPYCYASQLPDPVIDQPSPMMTKQQYCPRTESSVANYQAHSAPIGFVFYNADQFPAAYKGDAFVAFRGSWNRDVPTGYKVVRVHFGPTGMPATLPSGSFYEDFVSGWLIEGGAAHFGRIAGLAVDRSGALLIAEDTNGVIYRVSHAGSGADAGTDGGADGGTGDGAADAASDLADGGAG